MSTSTRPSAASRVRTVVAGAAACGFAALMVSAAVIAVVFGADR